MYDFPFGYMVQNACFCWFLVDYSLLPADINISWPKEINIISFTSKKVVRTRGEPQKMLFLGVQSHHLRNAKIQGSTGWNCLAPNMTHWEASHDPRTVYRVRIHHHKAFGPYLGPFWHPEWLQKDQLTPQKALTGRKAPEHLKVPWACQNHHRTPYLDGQLIEKALSHICIYTFKCCNCKVFW